VIQHEPAASGASFLLAALRISLEDFILHGVPEFGVQLDEARREPHLRDVARPWQIDHVIAHRMRRGPADSTTTRSESAIGLFQIVRDEHHRFAVSGHHSSSSSFSISCRV